LPTLSERPGDTVVRIGAGDSVSELAERVAPEGDVLVVDHSVDALERLRKTTRASNIFYLVGSMDVLPLPDATADELLATALPSGMPSARSGVPTSGADGADDLATGRLADARVEIHLGTEEEGLLDDVELLIKGPGVPGESPLAAAARARGIPIWSEIELGFRLLRNPFVGITGTNGKTTTTELLGAMFRAAGTPVA